LAIAALSLLAALAFMAPASQAAPVNADHVLLQTVPSPWGDEFNAEAMQAVFGANWETQTFDAVQTLEGPGGLFAPHVKLIWIEGSDDSTEAAIEFIQAHEAELKAFVARGGSLFINDATNQEVTLEYDGHSIGQDNPDDFTGAAAAVAPDHPIFKGPATPNATSFTGDSFAHGRIAGPGLTALIVGTENDGPVKDALVLAEYGSGTGHVMLGAMTVLEFQFPEDAARSLRINILAYLAALATPPPPPPPPPPADTVKPKVKFTGVPKKCVEEGFRFRVKVSDEGGVGSVRVKLGGKLLKKVDGKGRPSKLIKAKVPDQKLTHPGKYRLKAIARDLTGNVKRQSIGFKVCA
jgi:hypothetical protein